MTIRPERFRSLSWRNAKRLALTAGLLFAAECYLLFPLFFQPSWAKGWPGISQSQVFSAVMTFLVDVGMLTLSFGASSLVGFSLERRLAWPYLGWSIVVGVTMAALVAALLFSPRIYGLLWLGP